MTKTDLAENANRTVSVFVSVSDCCLCQQRLFKAAEELTMNIWKILHSATNEPPLQKLHGAGDLEVGQNLLLYYILIYSGICMFVWFWVPGISVTPSFCELFWSITVCLFV